MKRKSNVGIHRFLPFHFALREQNKWNQFSANLYPLKWCKSLYRLTNRFFLSLACCFLPHSRMDVNGWLVGWLDAFVRACIYVRKYKIERNASPHNKRRMKKITRQWIVETNEKQNIKNVNFTSRRRRMQQRNRLFFVSKRKRKTKLNEKKIYENTYDRSVKTCCSCSLNLKCNTYKDVLTDVSFQLRGECLCLFFIFSFFCLIPLNREKINWVNFLFSQFVKLF